MALVQRARDALDVWRYDPPAWSIRQIVIVILIVIGIGLALYWSGRSQGYALRGHEFEARMVETVARVQAEDQARIDRLAADLAAARAQAQIERERAAAKEASFAEALEAAARVQPVAGACEVPTGPLNQVIAEVNNARLR